MASSQGCPTLADKRKSALDSGEATEIRISRPTVHGQRPKAFEESDRAPTLTILEGPRGGQVLFPVPVNRRAIFLGRDRNTCDWWIDDPSISRRHCRVFVFDGDEGPVLRIQDLESTNGTYVNGERIREADLNTGDKIHVADVLVRYDLMDQADLQFQQSLVTRALRGERDALTGLLTRQFLEDRLPGLVEETERSNGKLTLVMIDLDHFKQVNDKFGHAAGDVALQRASKTIVEAIRRRDPAVRMGGEELAAFLPNTPLIEGYHVAERIRRSIEELSFEDCHPGVKITASMGVSEKRAGEPLDSWINRADEALYAAKRQGRNRVFVDDRR